MKIEDFAACLQMTSPTVSQAEIAHLEQKVEGEFPDDYRSFLLKCNGGYIESNVEYISSFTSKPSEFCISSVGGVRHDEPIFSLDSMLVAYHGRIPSDLFWIMSDPCDNAYCIGLRGENFGQIFFWDHEYEPVKSNWDGGIESSGNTTLIADSFSKFIDGLQITVWKDDD